MEVDDATSFIPPPPVVVVVIVVPRLSSDMSRLASFFFFATDPLSRTSSGFECSGSSQREQIYSRTIPQISNTGVEPSPTLR